MSTLPVLLGCPSYTVDTTDLKFLLFTLWQLKFVQTCVKRMHLRSKIENFLTNHVLRVCKNWPMLLRFTRSVWISLYGAIDRLLWPISHWTNALQYITTYLYYLLNEGTLDDVNWIFVAQAIVWIFNFDANYFALTFSFTLIICHQWTGLFNRWA